MIHLRAAELHFRYFVFLGSSPRSDDLTKLFVATTSFLGRVLDLETSPGELIGHSTNYILQMIVSAAFALMKLLKSNFSRHIDFNHGKLLFNGAISAIRRISVMDHDRPIRLADILAQMWNAGSPKPEEDGLQLKVRCRMSMSHVYDTVWRWRQRFRPTKSIEEMQGEFIVDCYFFFWSVLSRLFQLRQQWPIKTYLQLQVPPRGSRINLSMIRL